MAGAAMSTTRPQGHPRCPYGNASEKGVTGDQRLVPDLLRRLHSYFAGERVSFADVPLDEDWGRRSRPRSPALRAVPWARWSATASSPQPCPRRPGRGHVLRREPLLALRPLPPRRLGGWDRRLRLARRRVQAPACSRSRARGSMALSDELRPSWPLCRSGAAAAGSPRCRRSSTRRAAFTCAAAVRSRCTSTCRPRRSPGRSRCCATGIRSEIVTHVAARSTGRRAISCTSEATLPRSPRSSRRVSSTRSTRCWSARRSGSSVGPAAAAPTSAARLGGGTLSGPRSPHLELRTTSLEGAEFLRSVAAIDEVRLESSTAAATPSPTQRVSTRSSRC